MSEAVLWPTTLGPVRLTRDSYSDGTMMLTTTDDRGDFENILSIPNLGGEDLGYQRCMVPSTDTQSTTLRDLIALGAIHLVTEHQQGFRVATVPPESMSPEMVRYIPMYPVTSTSIKASGYDADSWTLAVEFQNGGIYRYAELSSEDYTNLLDADSVGKEFARSIRTNPQHPWRKVLVGSAKEAPVS